MIKVKLPFYLVSKFNVTLDLLVHLGCRAFLCLLGSWILFHHAPSFSNRIFFCIHLNNFPNICPYFFFNHFSVPLLVLSCRWASYIGILARLALSYETKIANHVANCIFHKCVEYVTKFRMICTLHRTSQTGVIQQKMS